jgi:hypothetical protein
MVAVAVWVATARVTLMVMAPWAGTVVAVSPPLVRSYGGDSTADVQEPGVEEPNGEEPYKDDPCSRRGLTRSCEELKQE